MKKYVYNVLNIINNNNGCHTPRLVGIFYTEKYEIESLLQNMHYL